jgi:hypothetical protein
VLSAEQGAGGRRVLLLLNDDNFGATQTTRLIAVAVSEESLFEGN